MPISLAADGSYLSLPIGTRRYRFHAIWLRHNAFDEHSVSATNGQRLEILNDIPASISIDSARLGPSGTLDVCFSNSDEIYRYSLDWLENHSYDRLHNRPAGWIDDPLSLWNSNLGGCIPTVSYPRAVSDRRSLGRWLAAIRRYGFAMMTSLPDHPDNPLMVANLFGYIRETNYGRIFDVRTSVDPINLAYTSLGLQAHTDNPYRDPAPTLQILSCIENSTHGGESVVVDGFNAATVLRDESPEYFSLLTGYPARFSFRSSDGVHLQSKRPIIELSPDGELRAIRFNNRSSAPLVDIPFDKMVAYYCALRHFSGIIERKENSISFRLNPNELFLVDNTRVLHSRSAYSGSGNRWLRGCYPDKDGLLSTLAAIEQDTDLEQS